MPCGRWRRLRPPGASESGSGAGRPTERQMAQVEAARREVRHSPAPRSTPAPGRPAGRPFIVPQPPVRPLAPAPAQPATAASLCRRQAWRCPCRHSSVATILRDRAHGRSRARRPPCRPRFGAWTCAGCARPRALAKRPPGCAQIVLVKQNKQSSTLSTWATSPPPPPIHCRADVPCQIVVPGPEKGRLAIQFHYQPPCTFRARPTWTRTGCGQRAASWPR